MNTRISISCSPAGLSSTIIISQALTGAVGDELPPYDLVSRGSSECYGNYNSGKGWGNGYINSCIHSNTIKVNGDLPTNWYNYVLASAGTIKNTDISDDIGTIEKATESICPKGWTLPDVSQINSNRDVAKFSPVLGGGIVGTSLSYESTRGFWWSSETYSSVSSGYYTRYFLRYDGNALAVDSNYRDRGYYIRCVQAP